MAALQEPARLQALARIAGAASHGGGLDGVLVAIAEGIRDAFGYDAVLNFLDPHRGGYVVRALVGEGGPELMGSENPPEAMEAILDPAHEVTPDVYFIPHEAGIDSSRLGPVFTPRYEWQGPGYWHPEDFCFVRMRTSRGKPMGVLSVDSPGGDAIPDPEGFELLRLFAMVGANAAENALLVGELAAMEAERETQALRDELQEEVALRRSLLEIGGRLGAESASAVDPAGIFPLVAERLDAVVPIKAVT